MRAAPTRILLEVTSRMRRRPPLALREAHLGRRLCLCRETVKLALHPCQQAAAFLMHTRPPDRMFSSRPRRHPGNVLRQSQRPYISDRRAFVVTRSDADTMASRLQDTEDEITEADNIRRCPHPWHPWPKAGHTAFYAC
jgi:hypothetical protein